MRTRILLSRRSQKWVVSRRVTDPVAYLESQGFIADHRDIELLKLRKFTLSKKIQDDLLLADDTQEKVTEILRPLVGFVRWLTTALQRSSPSLMRVDYLPQQHRHAGWGAE